MKHLNALLRLNQLLHGQPSVAFVNLIGGAFDQQSLDVALSEPPKLLSVLPPGPRMFLPQEIATTTRWIKHREDPPHHYAIPS